MGSAIAEQLALHKTPACDRHRPRVRALEVPIVGEGERSKALAVVGCRGLGPWRAGDSRRVRREQEGTLLANRGLGKVWVVVLVVFD